MVLSHAVCFFSYKRTLLIADQKSYLVTSYTQIVNVIKSVFQIVGLLLFKSFLLYLIISIFNTIVTNAVIAFRANKEYGYLGKTYDKKIVDYEKNKIYNNMRDVVLYKFGATVLDGTDNILISMICGVGLVGVASNYPMLTTQ